VSFRAITGSNQAGKGQANKTEPEHGDFGGASRVQIEAKVSAIKPHLKIFCWPACDRLQRRRFQGRSGHRAATLILLVQRGLTRAKAARHRMAHAPTRGGLPAVRMRTFQIRC
jgi:hypothetical protein